MAEDKTAVRYATAITILGKPVQLAYKGKDLACPRPTCGFFCDPETLKHHLHMYHGYHEDLIQEIVPMLVKAEAHIECIENHFVMPFQRCIVGVSTENDAKETDLMCPVAGCGFYNFRQEILFDHLMMHGIKPEEIYPIIYAVNECREIHARLLQRLG